MNSNDSERVEEFFSAVAEGDLDYAVDDCAPKYRDRSTESVRAYAQEDSLFFPEGALERLFLVLTRQYVTFEIVSIIIISSEETDAIEVDLRFSATTESVQPQLKPRD